MSQVLKNVLDKIADEQHYNDYDIQMEPISSGGANYTSQLYTATISSKDREHLHLFAKVAIIGDKLRSQGAIKYIYDTERLVYTKLAKVFDKLQDHHSIPQELRLVTAKFYGCNSNVCEETIVLEDLIKNGFSEYSRLASVDWEFASAAVTEMAKLHALSIAFRMEQPDECAEVAAGLKFTWTAGNSDEDKKLLWERATSTAIAVTKKENVGKLQEYYSRPDPNGFNNYMKALHVPVLVHGDYKPNNLVHKRHQDGHLETMLVDYQTMQTGSPIADLLYFIITGSDATFRAQYCDQLLEHYYRQLSQAMRRLGLQPEHLYSRENFHAEWKQKLPFGLKIAAIALPILTVDAENAPSMLGVNGISCLVVHQPSAVFSERFNGIVDDYVKWGVL